MPKPGQTGRIVDEKEIKEEEVNRKTDK